MNVYFTEKKTLNVYFTEENNCVYISLRKKLNAHLAEKKFFGLNTTTVDSLLFVEDKRDFTIKKINQIYNICACFDFMSSNLKVGCLSATLIS